MFAAQRVINDCNNEQNFSNIPYLNGITNGLTRQKQREKMKYKNKQESIEREFQARVIVRKKEMTVSSACLATLIWHN